MKIKIIAVLLTSVLCSCGGGTQDSILEPEQGAAVPIAQENFSDNPYDESTLAYSAQLVSAQANETAQISVSPEFTFKTSDTVQLALDFPEARGTRATVLICTDYSGTEGSYSVNYDSCLVRAPLVDGRLDHEMKVLSRHSTSLSVVWFAEPGSEPLYRELTMSNS